MIARWVIQPPRSHLCGQVAVAMIAGVELDEAIAAVGHRRSTTTRDVVRGLRHFGLICPDRLQRIERPPFAVGKLSRPKQSSSWHWVVCDGADTWDGIDAFEVLDRCNDWRLTSYLPVTKP
jgi:hypothetical protein